MPVKLHWFLPTNGDSRSDLSLGNAIGVRGSRIGQTGGSGVIPELRRRGLMVSEEREPLEV